MPLPLSEIFPDEDYRFHLTLRKGDLAEFFAPANPIVVTERRRWFERDPALYALGTEEAAPLLSEFEVFVREKAGRPLHPVTKEGGLVRRLAALGGEVEPDFVLLSNDAAGVFRVRAEAVCFPSSWTPSEKLGLTLDEVHGVVPGLNPDLGSTISRFLQKLKPGVAYERANWGLAATPELNMHPARGLPRLSSPFVPEQTWIRIEDQILAPLPETGGIVFGIRIRVYPFHQIVEDRALRIGLRRAFHTMPNPLALYKGMTVIREGILEYLAADNG